MTIALGKIQQMPMMVEANPAALIKTLKPKEALNERLLDEGEVRQLVEAA